jgi:serine/threonine protein kinase
MPRILNAGDRVRNYEIVELLGKGAFAISYRAKKSDGTPVFFKQYKMPTVTTPWYRGYMGYQADLKRRVETSRARAFCYRFVDFFEDSPFGSPCYFQVFEFVSHGKNLKDILDQIRSRPRSINWDQRVIFAKVLMAGINALHEAKVVHTDLKPENVQLFDAPETEAKYTLKLIDMDWSILADKTPPWHGSDIGYIGTPGYMSPEHLRGTTPVPASDVFTCGLLLWELLVGGHPYATDDNDEYKDRALRRRTAPPRFAGAFAPPASDATIAEIVFRCLDPQPASRPSAMEVNRALVGAAASKPPSPPPPRPSPAPSPRKQGPPVLALVGPAGARIDFRVQSDFGSALCKQLGGEARYWSGKQVSFVRTEEGWVVEPATGTTNETLLNGRAVKARTPLKSGDVLAVGNESKRIMKSPFTVRIG